MAYANEEDHQFMAEQGFIRDDNLNGYVRKREACVQTILAVWENKKHGDLDVPAPDEVFWNVSVTGAGGYLTFYPVVRFSDRQVSPISAFVTAEIRQWVPE